MKIGLIWAIDILPLFRVLNQFDHEYIIFWDQNWWPYWDKDIDFVVERVTNAIFSLKDKGVEKIILNPTLEIYFRYILKNDNILDFSEKYFLYCLDKSLVWKLWFAGDLLDKLYFQDLFKKFILPNYKLNDNQNNIKKFNRNFPLWLKHTPMRKYYLVQFGFRDRMVRKTIKIDLKYFKDADVDSFMILNWWYLAFDKFFRNYLKYKRIRYHGINVLIEIFKNYKFVESKYQVNIISNGPKDFLLNQKKFLYLLQRWKQININFI